MDKKDKIILYELDKNAKQPLSKIAKIANLSRESILYRLNKYKKEKTIRDFLTVINMSKLNYFFTKIYIKLHNITETQEKELINDLKSNKDIAWVASCDGKYSLVFGPKAKNMQELNNILREITNKYNQFILNQDNATILSAHHFYRDYLIDKKATTERKIKWGEELQETNLDETNLEILNELSKNTRIPAVEIAKKLNLSPDAIIKRIKSLEKAGIIEHYMIWPDVNKLIGEFYKVLVTLKNLTKEKEKQIQEYCLQHPNIVYLVNTLGPWQLELDVEVENTQHFREVIRDFLNTFPEVVSDYTPLNVYEEYKFRFFEK